MRCRVDLSPAGNKTYSVASSSCSPSCFASTFQLQTVGKPSATPCCSGVVFHGLSFSAAGIPEKDLYGNVYADVRMDGANIADFHSFGSVKHNLSEDDVQVSHNLRELSTFARRVRAFFGYPQCRYPLESMSPNEVVTGGDRKTGYISRTRARTADNLFWRHHVSPTGLATSRARVAWESAVPHPETWPTGKSGFRYSRTNAPKRCLKTLAQVGYRSITLHVAARSWGAHSSAITVARALAATSNWSPLAVQRGLHDPDRSPGSMGSS
jgi:hypothetical protein